jgi:hypothetical protein
MLPYGLSSEEYENFRKESEKGLDIYICHTRRPEKSESDVLIKATSVEDLKTGLYWGFMVRGKMVYPPEWFMVAMEKAFPND